MIRQSGGHARGSMMPLGLNQSRGIWSLLRQRQAQTHMRPGKVVEGLQEHYASPHMGTKKLATLQHAEQQALTHRSPPEATKTTALSFGAMGEIDAFIASNDPYDRLFLLLFHFTVDSTGILGVYVHSGA